MGSRGRAIVAGLLLITLVVPFEAVRAESEIVIVNKRAGQAKDRRGSVTFVDPETHEAIATVETGLRPKWAAFGPGRRHVYVLNSGMAGFVPPSKIGTEGSLVVVDAVARTVAASIPLDPVPISAFFSSDGRRLFVVCGGKKLVPPSVLAVDLATHEPTGKVVFGEPRSIMAAQAVRVTTFSPAGLLFILTAFSPRSSAKPFGGVVIENSELAVVDPVEMRVVARHTLAPGGATFAVSTDGKRVYALCRGHPKETRKAAKKDLLGKLYVLDGETGELVAEWEAGFQPRMIGIDAASERVFLSTERDALTRLMVVERGELRAAVLTAGRPLRIHSVPGSTEILLHSVYALTLIDTETWKVIRTTPLPFDIVQMLKSPDGTRAYLAGGDGRFSAVDLSTGKLAPTQSSGRKGVKARQAAGRAAATAGIVVLTIVFGAAAIASGDLDSVFDMAGDLVSSAGGRSRVINLRADTSVLGLSPDGRRLLVLNRRTNDVTVVDTAEWKILEKIPTGHESQSILPSPDGTQHYVLAGTRLSTIEAGETVAVKSHEIDEQRGTRTIFVLRERNEFWLLGNRGMDVFELDSGELKKSVYNLPRPMLVLNPAAKF